MAIDLGNAIQSTAEQLDQILGAVSQPGAKRKQLVSRYNALKKRVSLLQRKAPAAPGVAALRASTKVVKWAIQQRFARKIGNDLFKLEQATHVIPVNVRLLPGQTSDAILVRAPFSGMPWKLLAIGQQIGPASGVAPRLTRCTIAGIDQVITANVTYGAIGASPFRGIDTSAFSYTGFTTAGIKPWQVWRPWALPEDGILASDAVVELIFSLPADALVPLDFTIHLFVQSSPCDPSQMWKVNEKGFVGRATADARKFKNVLRNLVGAIRRR